MKRTWAALAVLAVSTLSACDALLVAPEPLVREAEVSLALVAPLPQAQVGIGDLSGALSAVRLVSFRLGSGASARDTVVPARIEDGAVDVRLLVHPDEARGWLEIQAELRMGNGLPLFRGQGLLQSYHLSPRASIEIVPVVWAIASSVSPSFTALGDTIMLTAAGVFANTFPIAGLAFSWEVLDPSIAEVIGGNRLVSRSNGWTTLAVSALGTVQTFPLVVRQIPVLLADVGPADTTVAVGATFQARPYGLDGNGYPLLPGANVQWSARGAVGIDTEGVVTAATAGVGFVDARVGATVRTGQVTVTP